MLFRSKLHRFWHMGDALMTTGTMALLYPDVKPLPDGYNPDEDPTDDDILWGDANVDGKVEIADATLILQYLTNKDEYKLTDKGMKNADCANNGDGVTALDALAIQKMDAGIYKQSDFPVKE